MTWKPISELDRTKMQYVLIFDDGAQSCMLWNPRGFWERQYPIGEVARFCNPTYFMELPDNPSY